MPKKVNLDTKDITILNALQHIGDISNKALADIIELSPSATLNRVEKLKKDGYIKDITTRLDYKKLGYDYHVIVLVKMQKYELDSFLDLVEAYQRFIQYWECPVGTSEEKEESYVVLEALFDYEESFTATWDLISTEMGGWIPATVLRVDKFNFFDFGGSV